MTITEEIELHMARAFFASAWAEQVEDSDEGPNLSGKEIMNEMPTGIDPAALHAAKTLRMGMERANRRPASDVFRYAVETISDVYHYAVAVKELCRGDRTLNPENFGHYSAMQAMGHGVGLADAFGQAVNDAIIVPYVEFGGMSLEKDYYKPRDES